MESLEAMLGLLRSHIPGSARPTLLRAETAVEELLTNTLVHGAAGQTPGAQVWLAVSHVDDALRLRYQDTQPVFDPQARIGEALQRTANPMEQRPPGGLGLLMVYRLSNVFRYERQGERNCIELEFRDQLRVQQA
ncbi:MAG: ATP-binding protein [Rhodoferax sp.]|nr:ATP-binding protein [Rhodoferax sp.]